MNIFEALGSGTGKAILPGNFSYVSRSMIDTVPEEWLKSNDWVPYVPREKTKHKEVLRVTWVTEIAKGGNRIVYPIFLDKARYTKYDLTKKPEMTMTLEWEE